ncbi:hypothetical protein MESS2_190028 [Mesorhizobium metallidurans STM 2683]|uniref:Uncharacterized protein n=1 Tax=Mesorhizobium metallidurans STM 2683 TaxID=1297569 RepID=M5EMH5_9HYPH|nr:hypothetical protein MESS2_190028 [Mesorhizobium metallidurans STM 2683]
MPNIRDRNFARSPSARLSGLKIALRSWLMNAMPINRFLTKRKQEHYSVLCSSSWAAHRKLLQYDCSNDRHADPLQGRPFISQIVHIGIPFRSMPELDRT